jgi:putative NADH-flavin reductase
MKCAIIGHGKMGREIERILAQRGHSVELVIDEANVQELTAQNLAGIDVCFEFTTPESTDYYHGYKYKSVTNEDGTKETITILSVDYLCERICEAA